jgi:hypothetical protein
MIYQFYVVQLLICCQLVSQMPHVVKVLAHVASYTTKVLAHVSICINLILNRVARIINVIARFCSN